RPRRGPRPAVAGRWGCRGGQGAPRCLAVRVRRVCSTTSRLQHPCGEEAEDEPAEEYTVDDERQEGVLGDVAHEERDDGDGDDEGDEGGAGGFEGAEYFGRAGA